jgi:hypothetical protein
MPFSVGLRRDARLSWLSLAALLAVPASSAAQTIIVRSAPAGGTIEVLFNGSTVGSATSDTNGDATVSAAMRTAETAVLMHVDACDNRVRVLIVERGQQPGLPPAGCGRTDVGSVFAMRPITTFVVDMTGSSATVHLRQGPAPPEWVQRDATGSKHQWGTPATGLVLSAGAGLSTFGNVADAACGDAPTCSKSGFEPAVTLGADFWITRFAAATIGYQRLDKVVANGAGDTYRFNSQLESHLFAVGGKGGFAVGAARPYGFGGLDWHEAVSTTSETINDATVVVNGVTQTIAGGTQTFAQQTKGWSWFAGGGVEGWVTRWVAVYGEFTRARVKGKPVAGGEGGIDDTATLITGGIRLHIGK